ncbi:hypothetical protein D3C76_1841400 [compost metagenome]
MQGSQPMLMKPRSCRLLYGSSSMRIYPQISSLVICARGLNLYRVCSGVENALSISNTAT